jgi:hypothetical protein
VGVAWRSSPPLLSGIFHFECGLRVPSRTACKRIVRAQVFRRILIQDHHDSSSRNGKYIPSLIRPCLSERWGWSSRTRSKARKAAVGLDQNRTRFPWRSRPIHTTPRATQKPWQYPFVWFCREQEAPFRGKLARAAIIWLRRKRFRRVRGGSLMHALCSDNTAAAWLPWFRGKKAQRGLQPPLFNRSCTVTVLQPKSSLNLSRRCESNSAGAALRSLQNRSPSINGSGTS